MQRFGFNGLWDKFVLQRHSKSKDVYFNENPLKASVERESERTGDEPTVKRERSMEQEVTQLEWRGTVHI